MDLDFHIDCPEISGIEKDYRTTKGSLRDYAHPIDGAIIKVLDNPLINNVFKTLADVGADTSFGQMLASGVPLNETNYPEMNKILDECCKTLSIRRPYAVVTNEISGLNAFTTGSDEEPFLVISSLLMKLTNKDQVKFIIGHECGHIAMGHVAYHSALSTISDFSTLIPVIGPIVANTVKYPLAAWSRRSEITADRAGLICCGNVDVAKKALLKLEIPFQNINEIDIDEYVKNSDKFLEDSPLRKIGEINALHPIISKRIHALDIFSNSQKYFEITKQNVPDNAIDNSELIREIENIVRVL